MGQPPKTKPITSLRQLGKQSASMSDTTTSHSALFERCYDVTTFLASNGIIAGPTY